MSIYNLKSQFQNLLRPISDGLVKQGYTANQVTVSAIVLSGVTAYIVAYPADSLQDEKKRYYILPVSLFIRMAMNAIDGMMAKEHGQASQLGAVLNETGDMVSDSMLIASLYPSLNKDLNLFPHANNSGRPLLLYHNHAIMALSLTTEITAITSQLLTNERANHGPLGKSDRAFVMGLLGVSVGSGLLSKSMLLAYAKHLYLLNELLLIKTILNRGQFIGRRLLETQYQGEIERLQLSNKRFNKLFNKSSNTAFNNLPNQNINISKQNHFQDIAQNKHQGITQNKHQDKTMTNETKKPTAITEHISSYNGYDDMAMFYRYWLDKPLAEIQSNLDADMDSEKIVIMLHRGHEHSARLTEMAHAYVQAGYQVFAWDARGNGRSGGERDHADSFAQLVRDLDHFVNLVKQQTHARTEQLLIIASSLGAVIASSWVHDYAPNVRGMILGTPAFAIRLYVPFAKPALKIAKKFGLVNRVSSYVKAKVLTHDAEAQEIYNQDPLISSGISRDLLISSLDTGQRLVDDAGAFTTPTFIICAGKDYVVDKQIIRDFYEQIRSPIKRWQLYPDSYHAIFHELNKQQVFADCLEFSHQVFAKPVETVDLTQAHKPHTHAQSYSKDRVDRLAVKGFNPSFAVTKFAMQKFGHISDGVATGLKHGFDSGSSLQKVYDYAPKGSNLLGKFIDNFYLNNIGWQGIRIRKEHLLELANVAINQIDKSHSDGIDSINRTAPNSIRVMDIASGNGQYLFELMQAHDNLSAQMRDYDSHNIEVMQAKAEKLGLGKRVQTVQKDAFDSASYDISTSSKVSTNSKVFTNSDSKSNNNELLNDKFDIAIASGVFELFSDNEPISTAINGIHKQLKDGGYFIYTNQPWHPEQEFIGKTLNSHRGNDWVMRCRSQAEMDQLVQQAGFEKISMRIDEFGIFTVSLAKKMDRVSV